ncbi:MAG: cation-translocating P-type ATPase [Oscillospiraceae bacterium]|nr:cation-translocating P-type ATPase [Oscillospiraceae bacterium]
MLEYFVKEIPTEEKKQLGLPQEEAERRLECEGENILSQPQEKKLSGIFVNQFRDVMVLILLAAAVISALLGEMYDSVTILLIVLINSAIGFVQEYRTEKTLEALREMTAPTAKVYRDGYLQTLPASQLVRGDVIELEAGDRIPADCFILSMQRLSCDESMLTGETVGAEKRERQNETGCDALNLPFAVYMGTTVLRGRATCEVALTGKDTQMGKVSDMLENIEEGQTPLQKRLAQLGKVLSLICVGVCVIVFAVGLIYGFEPFSMLMTALSIAIAAIPEGLPATVTIALALAVRRMLKRQAFVHKLHSVETLGCASVICSDKTGTITENKMTVTKIVTAENEFSVTGSGLSKKGQILSSIGSDVSAIRELLICSVICNNASISAGGRKKGEYEAFGDPTEIAMLIAAAKGGVTVGELSAVRLSEIPFESEARQMSVTAKLGEKEYCFIKGASDVILKQCGYVRLSDGIKQLERKDSELLLKRSEQLASQALRVIAFAVRQENKTIFLGFMGMLDPPRPEAKEAVKLCSKAHIRTVMITGDHKLTAIEIAKQAGIFHSGDIALTGEELSALTDTELDDLLDKISVFARVSPADKLRIVRAFKSRGDIVAMTGDGVNDAPAVKEADIGVAMGISGTDVTKNAANVILLDDNFATLVSAVQQGRTIYANIRKTVRYLISCNIGEIMTMLFGIILGLPVVLLPIQLLFVNLVTDSLPAISLSQEPTEESVMRKKPRRADESFFSDGLMTRIVFRGLLIGIFTLGCFVLTLHLSQSIEVARTCALITLVMSQLVHVFECKSEEKNILTVKHLSNPFMLLSVGVSLLCLIAIVFLPPLQVVFKTVLPAWKELAAAVILSFGASAVGIVISKI